VLAVKPEFLVHADITELSLLTTHNHERWLDLKLGLSMFLLRPLESMHAYVCYVWIGRGLRQTPAPPLVWLSLRKPF